MRADKIKNYFSLPDVVFDYARAVLNVGLWDSEGMVFSNYFKKDSSLLELGCGAGRIALNLEKLGYSQIIATDFSSEMIDIAKIISAEMQSDVHFEVQDATSLTFADESFDGVIFGFNGLMQIPLRKNRRKALLEISRVLKSGGIFAFTTHDQEVKRNAEYWQKERKRWQEGTQDSSLDEFGDIHYKDERGELFIHSPTRAEIDEDLAFAGFEKIFEKIRSDIADEPQNVLDFSDDCIFRVCKKT